MRKTFRLTILALVVVLPTVALAGFGQILGTVLNEKSGEPLIGASVQLEGTTMGAACDIDGRYVIRNVPHGTHTLLIASVGYAPKRITEVAVTNGEPVMIDASLTESVTELQPIEVTAERARATESAVLVRRRAAVNVTDGMSAEMIRKAGDSHAGDALRRVVGVSVVDGRNLVVRGMGGRYSNVLLNGAPIPSPEPEKREVPLDLFPGALLDEVTASKTFTPDKPGSFTGGSVDLATREFPVSLSYGVTMTRSYNTEATGETMLTHDGGNLDWLAVDDGTRDMPDGLRDGDWGIDSNPEKNQRLGQALSDQWTPGNRQAPWNTSVGANVGNSYMLSESSKLGVLASLSYSNAYKVRHEVFREWAEVSPSLDLGINRGTQSVLWGSLLNLTLNATESHKFSFKGLYNRSSDDEARSATGWYQNDDANILDHRLRFSQRSIASGQVSGDHQVSFPFASTFSWRAQLAGAGYDEPDTRSIRFNLFEDENGDTAGGWINSHYSGVHIYQSLEDDDAMAASDWTIPLSHLTRLKTGILAQNRTRYAEALRFRFNNKPSGYPPRIGPGEEMFADPNIGPSKDQYYLENLTFPDDIYDVNEHTLASYVELDAAWGHWRFVAGTRYEDYNMALHTGSRETVGGRVLIEQNKGDWMPMASIIVGLSERMNIRGVVSRTVARPEFRELAPFEYQDLAVGRPSKGNPELQRTSIVNYDLRSEYYPSPGEVIALTGFAKSFEDPIERVTANTSGSQPIYTFVNAQDAQNYGVELEGRKDLVFLPGPLSRLAAGGNLTLVRGEVTTVDPLLEDRVTDVRPLQGQSEWTLNLNLGYTSAHGGTNATIVYNAFGERISRIDLDGREPWYEQPRHTVDMSLAHRLWSTATLKLGMKNLFNEKYQVTQVVGYGELEGQEVVLEEYELGRTFSIGLSYGL